MDRHIIGLYPSVETAVKTVNVLQLKGYRSEAIWVFANQNSANQLKEQLDVNVHSTVRNHIKKEKTFFDQVKGIFITEEHDNRCADEVLYEFGMNDEEVNTYLEKLNNGQILVIVQDDMKLGHPPEKRHVTKEEIQQIKDDKENGKENEVQINIR